MKIDFNPLLHGEKRELSFSHSIDVSGFTPDILSGKAEIDGTAVDHSGFIELKLSILIDAVFICSRCAEDFGEKRRFEVEYSLCETLANPEDNEDFIQLEDGLLDIDELAETSVILNLPVRFLCKKDCKGLCPQCGNNLNRGKCGCSHEKSDPRLAKLSEYLEKIKNNDTEEVE